MDLLIRATPGGWTEHRLDKLCEILAGPSTTQVNRAKGEPKEVPVVTPPDLRHNRVANNCAKGVSDRTAELLSRYRLRPDDIVCARTGALGRAGLVGADQGGWIVGSSCVRVRVRDSISAAYLVHYLGHPLVRDWIVRNTGGAVIPTLTTKILGALPVAVPPPDVQAAVADTLGALDDKVIVHEKISNTTAALRDALRLEMLSGETR